MSALEVLQSCLAQHKVLLAAIGAHDSLYSNLVTFDVENNKPHLTHYTSIQIQVNHNESTIWRTVVDEGASMCLMSITCWKGLSSPTLIPSPRMLKVFYGHKFQSHGTIPYCFVELGGKTVDIQVEAVNTSLDYKLLLSCSWTYMIEVVVSSIYKVIKFPHQGKIMSIDQLSFSRRDPMQFKSNIPIVSNFVKDLLNVVVDLYPSLMGTLTLPPSEFNMISHIRNEPLVMEA